MRRIFWFAFLAGSALAQNPAPPAFEVASVKINQQYRRDDPSTWRPLVSVTPGSLSIRNATLRVIVAWAYDTQRPQVAGPEWIDVDRYDIVAKAGGPAKDDEMRPMLRALLAERFKLESHRETRQMEVMGILLPKGGHKMTASKVTGPTQNRSDPVRGMVVEGAALAALANEFSREFTVPVVDMTGLEGRFDFAFNPAKYAEAFRSSVMASGVRPNEEEARVTLMQNILTGEMGLKLESRKAAVEILVIDRAEKSPVGN